VKNLRLAVLVLFVASCGPRADVAKRNLQERLRAGGTTWEAVNAERYNNGLKWSAVYVHESGRFDFEAVETGSRGEGMIQVRRDGNLLVTYLYSAGTKVKGMWEKGSDFETLKPILNGPGQEFADAVAPVPK
jgi:hypothetical protein